MFQSIDYFNMLEMKS